MNCLEPNPAQSLMPSETTLLDMPLGLLGFEQYKRFALQADHDNPPFLWLQVAEQPGLSFLVLSPFLVVPDYRPEITDEDASFLGLQSPANTLVFSIVTLRDSRTATLNLKGPLIANRRTLVAKQVIPVNASALSAVYPLPVQAA